MDDIGSLNEMNRHAKDLDKRSSEWTTQSAHSRKLSKKERYRQSDIDFTVDSPSNIKEPRTKNYTKIEVEPRIMNFIEIERHSRIKNFIHRENPNVTHDEKRKGLFS